MRCVAIMWDLTHAHVKQDTQAMETPALVRKSLLCSFHLLQLKFWFGRNLNNLLLTVCSKQIDEMRSQAASLYHRISATMVIVQICDHFLGLKVNWFDTLTVKQWEIMINNDVLLFLRPMWKHLTSSSIIAFIALKIINSVFLVLFSS